MRKHGVILIKISFSLNCHTLYIDSLFCENGMKNEDRNTGIRIEDFKMKY